MPETRGHRSSTRPLLAEDHGQSATKLVASLPEGFEARRLVAFDTGRIWQSPVQARGLTEEQRALLVGAGFLDGLIRMDLSHGLRGPHKRLRFDLYLDAIL